MFTGIIAGKGTVVRIDTQQDLMRLAIKADFWHEYVLGESIAVNGVCLTVASWEESVWYADVMAVTTATSNLGQLKIGDVVNLEKALAVGERLGGHIVQGHVDGIATLTDRSVTPEWTNLTFSLPETQLRYVVKKGSICLNGVSLTVAELVDNKVTVSLIPTTLDHTNLGYLSIGEIVNFEVDVIAKYVENLVKND